MAFALVNFAHEQNRLLIRPHAISVGAEQLFDILFCRGHQTHERKHRIRQTQEKTERLGRVEDGSPYKEAVSSGTCNAVNDFDLGSG